MFCGKKSIDLRKRVDFLEADSGRERFDFYTGSDVFLVRCDFQSYYQEK